MDEMFGEAEVTIALSLDAAKRALDQALSGGGLVDGSRRAVEEGLAFVMPVGPRGRRGPSKEVLVRLLPARQVEQRTVVPLRWEVTTHGRLFPVLDANLGLAPDGLERTVLSVVGCYTPPLGALGATLDYAVMSRVATSTMRSLLREVAAELLHLAEALPDEQRRQVPS